MNSETGGDRRIRELVDTIRRAWEAGPPFRPILLVGGIGDGKTATGMDLVAALRSTGLPVGGILAPRIVGARETVGYSVIDLERDERHRLVGLTPGRIRVGRFYVDEDGLRFAQDAIERSIESERITLVDEVGRLELHGGGHAPALRRLLSSDVLPILMVRDTLTDEVIHRFSLVDPIVCPIGFRSAEAAPLEDVSAFWEIVDSIPFPLLVTHGDDGFPQSRPMHLLDRDESSLWFATSRASRKVAQIAAEPRVTALFVDAVRFDYASFHGHAQMVDDPERAKRLWNDEWNDEWPAGSSDPDYALLRVVGLRGFYHRGATGRAGEIDLS